MKNNKGIIILAVISLLFTPLIAYAKANDHSDNLPPDIRVKLEKFVGKNADEMEIARCAEKVEKIIGGLVKPNDYRKIAIATKVKMAVNVPKQNVVNMITFSYPGIITNSMAANIYDSLAEQ